MQRTPVVQLGAAAAAANGKAKRSKSIGSSSQHALHQQISNARKDRERKKFGYKGGRRAEIN